MNTKTETELKADCHGEKKIESSENTGILQQVHKS